MGIERTKMQTLSSKTGDIATTQTTGVVDATSVEPASRLPTKQPTKQSTTQSTKQPGRQLSRNPFRTVAARWSKRDSGIELLRILAMLMIIGHHLYVYSRIPTDIMPSSPFRFFILWQTAAGKIGVAVFFMISAWYLCDNHSPTLKQSLKRVWRLEREILFYSIGILIVGNFVLPTPSMGESTLTIMSLFPVATGAWWFATAYVMFLLIYPFLTEGLRKIGRKNHGLLCVVFLVAWGLLYGITQLGNMSFTNFSFGFFVYLYILISFYRWYMKEFNVRTLWSMLRIGFLMIALNLLLENIIPDTDGSPNIDHNKLFLCYEGKLPILLISFGLIGLFIRINWHNIAINAIASATSGVYLIHHHLYLRKYLWDDSLYPFSKLMNNPHAILICLLAILLVFSIATIIDLLRQVIFATVLDSRLDNLFDPLCDSITHDPWVKRCTHAASCLLRDK